MIGSLTASATRKHLMGDDLNATANTTATSSSATASSSSSSSLSPFSPRSFASPIPPSLISASLRPFVSLIQQLSSPPGDRMAESAIQFLERRRSSTQNIGSLKPDLYRRRGSVIIHEGNVGQVSVGRLQLQFSYDFVKSDFHVTVLEVRDVKNLEEFYFSLELEGAKRCETSRVIVGSTFHRELFKFPISYEDLIERRLTVQLIGCARIGSCPSVIGESKIDLSSIDPSDDIFLWTNIDSYEAEREFGEVLVGMQYLPSAERLTITVHEARNLKVDRPPDAYIRISLIQNGKVVKKRKTAVRKATDCPSWDEVLSFSISQEILASSHLELRVMDHDRVGNNRHIGRITFGENKRDALWKELVAGRSITPSWLPLKRVEDEDIRL